MTPITIPNKRLIGAQPSRFCKGPGFYFEAPDPTLIEADGKIYMLYGGGKRLDSRIGLAVAVGGLKGDSPLKTSEKCYLWRVR
jgi:hypothetical protein